MRLFQYQVRAEPVSTSKERTSPVKYGPQDYAPRANWNSRVAHAAVVLALNTAFAFTPAPPFQERVSIDKWHPVANTPRWDNARNQHLYPASTMDQAPRSEHVSVDRWHPEIEKPRWDLKRQQYLYPNLAFTEIAIASQVAPDLWLVRNELPRWDLKREQWKYPSLFYADIPHAEDVSVDRWHPSIEQPRRDRHKPIFESGAGDPYPISNVVTTPTGWLIQNAEPLRARVRISSESSARFVPVDQGESISSDKWEPQLRYRLWGAARRDYLYRGVEVELPTPNAIFVDSWIPAQVYLRPHTVPLYWITYGQVNDTIPGVHLPCILEADAVLVQPVGYDATLVQPVGYDAEEVACE